MNICIFASSSNDIDKVYFEAAHALGEQIAKSGSNIVYGGSERGLMGEITRSARKLGAEVIGVMPEKLYNMGIEEGSCTKFIITKGMRERKAKMDELSHALIALPGGFGTLEELSEMIVQKQLGYNNKPIVILNTNGFYNDLISFFNNIIKQKYAAQNSSDIYFVTQSAKDALDYILNYNKEKTDYISQKLKINL